MMCFREYPPSRNREACRLDLLDRYVAEPEASAQRNGSIRLQSLIDLPVSSPRKRTRGPPLDALPVLLWFFKLADFALEIIDAGVRIRQLTLKLIHFLAELLMFRIQFFELLQIELHIL